MPAIIRGPLQIHAVTTNAIVKFGDCFVISPKDVSRLFAGSGVFNTGFAAITTNGLSSTNFINPNLIDQPIIRNF